MSDTEFTKDILLIDFEGLREPIQIGAILLDRKTLEEKDYFCSYVAADMQGKTSKKSNISQKTLEGAPTQSEVGKIIFDKFGTEVLLSFWVADSDWINLKKIITAAGLDYKQYDYHILDLWPIAYASLIKKGYKGSVKSEDIFQAFGAKPRIYHDALEDCRIAADILRKIIQE